MGRTLPVQVTGGGPTCDVSAAWSKDKDVLTIAAINPLDEPMQVKINVRGARISVVGNSYVMANPDPDAFNSAAEPEKIQFLEGRISNFERPKVLPPYSVTIFRFTAAPSGKS